MRNRVIALALVGLAVPFPALALSGGSDGQCSPASLSVSASLDHCGLADTQILCKIDAGWNSIPGAEDYAITATSADGSVIDMGRTSGQSSSVWVPYAGPGTYSVQVTAWGTPPGEADDGKPEVIARSSSAPNAASATSKDDPPAATSTASSDGDETPADGDPAAGDPETPVDPVVEPPVCDPVPPVEEPPTPPDPPEESGDDAAAAEAPEVDDPQDTAGTIPVDDDCNS
jgi:hypothetical protein